MELVLVVEGFFFDIILLTGSNALKNMKTMNREQQRQAKEAKKQAKIALKDEKRQDKLDLKNWEKMKAKAIAKDAWID